MPNIRVYKIIPKCLAANICWTQEDSGEVVKRTLLCLQRYIDLSSVCEIIYVRMRASASLNTQCTRCLHAEPICRQSCRSLEKITSAWLLLKLSKLIRLKKKRRRKFAISRRNARVDDGEKVAKMVNDKVGPSQFRKLRFPSKDDNPQKLDNRVKELFKELGRLSRYMTNSLRKLMRMIINLIVAPIRDVYP